jgi:hypothetical protein
MTDPEARTTHQYEISTRLVAQKLPKVGYLWIHE